MSFTAIGRIGSQHTLTSTQDDAKYLFNSAMWCTHPLLGGAIFGDGFDITARSNIVTRSGTNTDFTLLCEDMQVTNVPVNRYIAYFNGISYGVLEVDYVLDVATLILKYPAFETVAVMTDKSSLIAYWETPILKEVEVRNLNAGSTPTSAAVANKFSSSNIAVYDVPYTASNEGGVEPMLISIDFTVILKY
jgi:hypothetical protein